MRSVHSKHIACVVIDKSSWLLSTLGCTVDACLRKLQPFNHIILRATVLAQLAMMNYSIFTFVARLHSSFFVCTFCVRFMFGQVAAYCSHLRTFSWVSLVGQWNTPKKEHLFLSASGTAVSEGLHPQCLATYFFLVTQILILLSLSIEHVFNFLPRGRRGFRVVTGHRAKYIYAYTGSKVKLLSSHDAKPQLIALLT